MLTDLEMPPIFRSATTGAAPMACDRCDDDMATVDSYLRVKVIRRYDDGRKPSVRLDVSACDKCFAALRTRLGSPAQARLVEMIDDCISKRLEVSDLRDDTRDAGHHMLPINPLGSHDGLTRDLAECRLCGVPADQPPRALADETFCYVAQFRGENLIAADKSRLTFGLPVTVCGCCEREGRGLVSPAQIGLIEDCYAEFDESGRRFGSILALMAENFEGGPTVASRIVSF